MLLNSEAVKSALFICSDSLMLFQIAPKPSEHQATTYYAFGFGGGRFK